jgi:hypothetical protein
VRRALATAAAVMLLTGCNADGPDEPAAADESTAAEPEGDEEHDIVGDGLFTPLKVDGQYMHTFDEEGTYDYRCTEHLFMRGRVVVTN